MFKVKYDNAKFTREMDNLLEYSLGFVDGAKRGYPSFLNQLGITLTETLKNYIDSNARVNPQVLHHVYEWSQTGSPEARLFEIKYVSTGGGLTFASTFSQSTSVKRGSTTPFYDKARIMEYGIPVTIVPKKRVLAFEENGQTIFTSKPITIDNPGGNVQGEYEKVFDSFFSKYLRQSFLESSGVAGYLRNPAEFKNNIAAGKRSGRSAGLASGQSWITKAGAI
jgi:hypothetical protein